MRPLTLLILLLLAPCIAQSQPPLGLRLPPGFEAVEHADGKLANDIYSLTFDPRGRVVVSGRGYIRTLIDDDGDGRADRAVEFAAGPKDGAQGMLWEGDSLFVTGDGGLRRYRDRDGDGKADGSSELIRALRTGGEHDAHAIRRGPDGWLYVLCGNMARADRTFAQLPTSPVREPVAGCVVRFTPDLKSSEIVADGFRNAYDMDFNPDGELFTFDSDNERCVALPWYEPTRLYHVVAGGHHGWLSPQRAEFWRLPPYFLDVRAPVATLGRGSPTGVACYRHAQFPERYRGGLFLGDWTFGKVYFVPLQLSGSTYTGTPEVFAEAVGDNGFAPTALAVHPTTGDLFVAVGGRGTRGAVYRIRYPAGLKQNAAKPVEPLRQSLEWRQGLGDDLLKQARDPDALERLRALGGLKRHRERFTAAQLLEAVRGNWDHVDRYVRQAAAGLITALPERERLALAGEAKSPRAWTTYALAVCDTSPETVLPRASQLLAAKENDSVTRLDCVRLVQRALGDVGAPLMKGSVWEGYTPRKEIADLKKELRQTALAALRRAFPAGDADLDRELSRTLALLEDDARETLVAVAERIGEASHPIEDLHYLMIIARLRALWPAHVTGTVSNALLALDRKLAARGLSCDLHWPSRVAEMYMGLAERDPALHEVLLHHEEFGRPDHALFARAPGFDQKKAAERFLERAAKDRDYRWNADLVEVVSALPPERSLPVLRGLWGKAGLDESILPLLAENPRPEDRAKLVTGLTSSQPTTVVACLEALQKLPAKRDGDEVLALLRALGQTPESAAGKKLQAALASYLAEVTSQKAYGAERQAWSNWFAKTYPELAARLENPDGVDVTAWRKRMAGIDWARGDPGRGKAVFIKANCAACHSGSQALGPDLAGVAGRFSRDDLLTSIVQPSRDVSARYRTTLIETTSGKLYQGLIIYEAVDGLILQTGAAATVRLGGNQIAARRGTQTSLMPSGLLDAVTDGEVADLYAYLRGLSTAGAPGK